MNKIGAPTIIMIVFGIILILFIMANITLDVVGLCNPQSITFTITEKGMKNTKNSGKYLIYGTLNDGSILVIENTDELFYGKFNSSDIYAELQVGATYEMKVIGYRIPFLSRYQNIIEYKLVE